MAQTKRIVGSGDENELTFVNVRSALAHIGHGMGSSPLPGFFKRNQAMYTVWAT